MDKRKRQAAQEAVTAVNSGDVVGLGSGSTAALAIDALGERAIDITGVPTSYQARQRALAADLSVVDLDQVDTIDIAIDGADQVANGNVLIKGGGGAHAREKIIDTMADRLDIVVDPSKLAETPDHPVPVEVLPSAHTTVARQVRTLGGTPSLREASSKSGPTVTDNGNLVLDCAFGEIDTPRELARELSSIPGVVEHGLFLGLADRIIVGTTTGTEIKQP